MTIAFIPGSFDPIHNGHVEVISAAAGLFEKLYVGVGVNSKKDYLLDAKTRVELIEQSVSDIANVEVVSFEGLTTKAVDYLNADVIVKGVRNASDFDHEMTQAKVNASIEGNIQTIFIPGIGNNALISSSYVREILSLGGSIEQLVPAKVLSYLVERFNK